MKERYYAQDWADVILPDSSWYEVDISALPQMNLASLRDLWAKPAAFY